ncbi:MAG TPA: DUF4349 domain-containing protein [Clostridiales bacterium]|jgi:hypothetical protein|nr:DUF4349 domain-containing protein [Clostridiaceae bacterium]HPV02262.1 DUF4349 domain-containing protein [Clostridiales bacterium]
MKRKLFGLFLAASLLMTAAAGCASKKAEMTTPADRSSSAGRSTAGSGYDVLPEAASEEAAYGDSLAGLGNLVDDISNPILDERKIIRSANLSIEVENFDTAFGNIKTIINGIGFIQETNINTERVYDNEEVKFIKRGTIVLRVDRSKFDSVLDRLNGIGEVYNYTTHGDDVTEQYYDVESRLRLLRLEQEKIEAYLAKLNDLDQIFKAESKLTEIRYQIESLTGKLNKLSSLVELSTITIDMYEKRPGSDAKPMTYGEKLLESLKGSLLGVVEFLGGFLLFIVSALPVLILLALFAWVCVAVYRRIARNRRLGYGAADAAAVKARPEAQPEKKQETPPEEKQ